MVVVFGEVMGGATLLEELCPREWVLRVHGLTPLPVHSFSAVFVAEGGISQFPAHAGRATTWRYTFLPL